MKHYVVTGGAGFIGSHLVRKLLADPEAARVDVVDNCYTGHRSNLAEVAEQIHFHDCDIRDYDRVAAVVAGADAVFHLAAVPSVPRSITDPLPSHDININGTFSVFRACAAGGVKRVVYAASSSAYGNQPSPLKMESMTPRPLSPYAVQKLAGEYYVKVFAECWKLSTVGLRFFNVFGPRQDPSSPYSGVVSLFIRHLVERRSPTVHGDGNQTRDFTYVEDVAELVIKASRATSVSGAVFNAGTGHSYSLNTLWAILRGIEGVEDLPVHYGPPRQGDVQHSLADLTLAREMLGHAPRFSFEEGLRRTLAWYKEQAATPRP